MIEFPRPVLRSHPALRVGMLLLSSLLTAPISMASPPPSPPPSPSPPAATPGAGSVPMQSCAGCHPATYAAFLRHGMARSLGPVDEAPEGLLTNARTGLRYEVLPEEPIAPSASPTALLTITSRDGGVRAQRIVGRIGAGLFDRSWAAVELDVLDVASREGTGRLFFAPVETVTGHGLELSPFEHSEFPSGPDMALTEGCLTCHTDTPVRALPAVRGADDGGRGDNGGQGAAAVHPANALGADAFAHLEPLDCAACHGDPRRHLDLVNGRLQGTDLGLPELGSLPAAQQLDVCARCHLQGDARFERVEGRPELDQPLLGQIPMVVPAVADDGFRFVGQVERLVLSDCFQKSEAMTCTTCHDPHRGVAEQGLASFERACQACHGGSGGHGGGQETKTAQPTCSRPAELTVASVTGRKARSEAGCVDCHVRRSQPYDLPGIRSTDHFIRKSPPPPRDNVPFRAVADPGGELELFDDPRARPALATAGGRQWREGILGMAYAHTGRFAKALEHFERFPAPGSPGAIRPTAPDGLEPLENWSTFHELRALALLANRRPREALSAYGDALELDPLSPGALLGRARLAFGEGDVKRALLDTQALIDTYPESEAPWQLRTRIAQRLGRQNLVQEALEARSRLWPSDARVWLELAGIYHQQGNREGAQQAVERVKLLQPSLLRPVAPAPSQ